MTTVAVPVSAADLASLSQVLDASDVPDHIAEVLVRAGAAESLDYATGRAVFSSMADLRMYRVFLLLKSGMEFEDSERLVAILFKLTPAGARRVVASSIARYSHDLRKKLKDLIGEILASASASDDAWNLVLPPGFLRDQIRELTRQSRLPDPTPVHGGIWRVPIETYEWLCDAAAVPRRQHPSQ